MTKRSGCLIRSTCLLLVSAFIACPQGGQAQEARISDANYRDTLAQQLAFEVGTSDGVPDGWSGSSATVTTDRKIIHGGQTSVRLARDEKSQESFSAITKSIPLDFQGSHVELRGHLRTNNVEGMVGLWMREDGTQRGLQFDNMQSRHIQGTTEWTEYSIILPIDRRANRLLFGVLLAGTGTAWADDLQLLVDGKSISDTAHVEKPATVMESDREFVRGSGIEIASLSSIQIDNLTKLGRLWGFLKYHHPAVTGGTKHWDFELFRILPSILNAPTSVRANDVLADWIDTLGPVPDCPACAKRSSLDVETKSNVEWIHDNTLLGQRLSKSLSHIYDNRIAGKQFYVELAARVGNPQFDEEAGYEQLKVPDAGYQLLALYRIWNIIEYWYPYRNLIGENWTNVLTRAIPEFALAKDDHAYRYALLKTIANVHDTHANLWSTLDLVPPEGDCTVSAAVRFIDSRAIVAATDEDSSSIQRGDVILAIDGTPLAQLMRRWKPYYAASNEPTVLRDIGRNMLRGGCGKVALDIERDKRTIHVETRRVQRTSDIIASGIATHDVPGDTFRLLSTDVAYLKLSSVKASDVAGYIRAAVGTKGLIVDIRNYPADFVVFALGQLLVERETPFARFTIADLSNPGAFTWRDSEKLIPRQPHYAGKVIVLVDEVSLSQAEYTAMALRASPHATVIGSTTAGADGNVSSILLPGGLQTAISGIGVFYPDKRPTQRVGIIPDIFVSPTVKGVRDGVDEPLERAKREVAGSDAKATPAVAESSH